MLESKLKKWQGKKVSMSYVYKDDEGNEYCPIKAMEELKKEIIRQGFTYTEDEKVVRINGTGQFFWKPNTDITTGTFNARSTKYELLEGKRVLITGQYPTKNNIIDYGDDFFIKKGGGCEVVYKLIG